jgi:hypothetical protein
MKKSPTTSVAFFLIAICLVSTHPLVASPIDGKKSLSIEPGIGISPMPIMDMTFSNIVQYDFTKRLSIISYSSLKENNLFLRNFNYIRSADNHTLSQKIGIGASLFTERSQHTFSFLGGVNYDTYHEFLENPDFEKVDVRIQSWSPDFGFMYNLKLGQKKCFFSFRMYLPLAPYPLLTRDVNAIDSNIGNISIEAGIGFRLK